MGSPKPFTIGRPTVATEIPVREQHGGRQKVDRGPNFFLTPDPDNGAPDGWLALSFTNGVWYDVPPCTGQWVEAILETGKNKGATVTRLTGEAAEVTRQLREAAQLLDIGVAIRYAAVTYKSGSKAGEEVPGKLVVKYLGQPRKQRKEKATAE